MSKRTVFAIVLAALVAGAVMGSFSAASAVDQAISAKTTAAAPCGMNPADCAKAAACDQAGTCDPASGACGTATAGACDPASGACGTTAAGACDPASGACGTAACPSAGQ